MPKLKPAEKQGARKSDFGFIWQAESNKTILLDLLFKEHIIQTH